MKLKAYKPAKGSSQAFKYLILFVTGILIILLCSLFQAQRPVEGEYHYSSFLRVNFSWLAKILFALTAFSAAWFYELNPWGIGVCLILIFPLTAIIEATFYPQSHNLIPFEMIMYFTYALPSMALAIISRFIRKRVAKKKLEKSKTSFKP